MQHQRERAETRRQDVAAAPWSNRTTTPALPPTMPPSLAGLLRPEVGGFQFTDSSYYQTETWRPKAMDASQAQDARDCLARLELALAPSDKGHLLARILALLSHYRADPHPPEVEYVIAQDWAEDLGEFPAWAVDEAARQWRRTRRFKPQICEIRAACLEIVGADMKALDRLRRLVEHDDQRRNPRCRQFAALSTDLAAAFSR